MCVFVFCGKQTWNSLQSLSTLSMFPVHFIRAGLYNMSIYPSMYICSPPQHDDDRPLKLDVVDLLLVPTHPSSAAAPRNGVRLLHSPAAVFLDSTHTPTGVCLSMPCRMPLCVLSAYLCWPSLNVGGCTRYRRETQKMIDGIEKNSTIAHWLSTI